MPKITQFLCPICESEFANRKEAEECFHSCKWTLSVRDITLFKCARCMSDFKNEADMVAHEAQCKNPIPKNILEKRECGSCEKCTAEGYISIDCKLLYPITPRSQCPTHEPARN